LISLYEEKVYKGGVNENNIRFHHRLDSEHRGGPRHSLTDAYLIILLSSFIIAVEHDNDKNKIREKEE
jgi:hypothetical protein